MKKENSFPAVFLIAYSFLICNCNDQPLRKSSLQEAKMGITKSNKTYFQTFAKRDASIFTSHHTYGCRIMPSDIPTLCGIDAPADFFKIAYAKTGVRNGRFFSLTIPGNGEEFVTEAGFYNFFNAKNEMTEDGKYPALRKKITEDWMMFRNLFSLNHNIE